MANGNHTMTTVEEFILVGITDNPDLQFPLFVVFFLNYLIIVMGNLGIIILIRTDTHLHSPMYFFLSHLAFVDLCYPTVISPKMLSNFLTTKKIIWYYSCAAQLGCFLTFLISEIFLLAVMAYDRYVAICNPLLYWIMMSQRVCFLLVSSCYIYSFSVAVFQTILTFRLSFCSSNVINHFYCDDLPLLALSCSDTSTKQMLLFVFAGFNTICTLSIVLISYTFILFAILKIRSAEGRQKAFSTCTSHLIAVTIFYSTLVFMYLQPSTNHSLGRDKVASVFYTLVIPMLNPLIYSLRNKEVKDALKRITERVVIVHR